MHVIASAHMDAGRSHLLALKVGDLCWAALLDGDRRAIRQPRVDSGHGRRNVEGYPAQASELVTTVSHSSARCSHDK